MARRRNSIAHRFARMRGLAPEEKSLMMRLGHLLDAALNNRQASNPFEPSKNKRDRVLYPPTGLTAATGNKSLTLTWLAADSDIHLRYEIEIRNNDTGISVIKSSYTNNYVFKGPNGSYTAMVKSVGRNGTSSEEIQLDFILEAQVMQLEGAKHDPTELGTMVQDHILLLKGYSLYIWGSVILDKYVAGSESRINNPVIFRLWSMEGADAIFDERVATLEQVVTLYPATESAADLDGDARGGSITRPESIYGRNGSFETSQSVMFDPRNVGVAEEDIVYTFFLQAINREIEEDEVNLSLTIWAGFDGVGDHIPTDPWDGGKASEDGGHRNSLWVRHNRARGTSAFRSYADSRGAWGYSARGMGGIGNSWTYAAWFRQRRKAMNLQINYSGADSTDPDNSGNVPGQKVIFHRRKRNSSTLNEIYMQTGLAAGSQGQTYHILTINVNDKDDAVSATGLTTFRAQFRVLNNDEGKSYMYPWGEQIARENDGWTFIVVCFEGGPAEGEAEDDNNYVPKIRVYLNNRRYDPHLSSDDPVGFHKRGMNNVEEVLRNSTLGTMGGSMSNPWTLRVKKCFQDDDDEFLYCFGKNVRDIATGGGHTRGSGYLTAGSDLYFHMAGMWNIAIDRDSPPGYYDGNNYARMVKPWYGPWMRVDSPVNGFPYPGEGKEPTPKWDWSYVYMFGDDKDEEILLAQPHIGEVGLNAINYLYSEGHGSRVNWKEGYPFGGNLVHWWKFGAIEEPFGLHSEVLRDTGHYIWGHDINLCTSLPLPLWDSDDGRPRIGPPDIFERGVYEWRTGTPAGIATNPPVYDSDRMAVGGGGPDQLSWTEFTTIADIQSPNGTNGTTANIQAYPGQRL